MIHSQSSLYLLVLSKAEDWPIRSVVTQEGRHVALKKQNVGADLEWHSQTSEL